MEKQLIQCKGHSTYLVCSCPTSCCDADPISCTFKGFPVDSSIVDLQVQYTSNIDLTGLEDWKQLELLTILGDSSSKIDISFLSKLTSLIHLTIQNTNISDISVLSKLNSLNFLDLSYNAISDIGPLGTLSDLLDLYLDFNPIKDICPAKSLKNLCRFSYCSPKVPVNNDSCDCFNKIKSTVNSCTESSEKKFQCGFVGPPLCYDSSKKEICNYNANCSS